MYPGASIIIERNSSFMKALLDRVWLSFYCTIITRPFSWSKMTPAGTTVKTTHKVLSSRLTVTSSFPISTFLTYFDIRKHSSQVFFHFDLFLITHAPQQQGVMSSDELFRGPFSLMTPAAAPAPALHFINPSRQSPPKLNFLPGYTSRPGF